MYDDQPREAPTSEEVSLALRHCWQPVARLEDLEDGPQRAVLLGEALAVFLTESGKPAVVADRCAHRGASLSMGKVAGEAIQCPYHGWEWAGEDGACTRIPSLARPEPDPAAGPHPGLPGARAVGPGLDRAGGAARRAAEPAVVRRRELDLGPRRRRSSCRSASG